MGKIHNLRIVLACVACLSVLSCSKDSLWGAYDNPVDPDSDQFDSSLYSITLNQTAVTLYSGDSFQLIATVSEGISDSDLRWSSENTFLVTVDPYGLVVATGYSQGTTTVRVTSADGLYSASCQVTVAPSLPGTTGTISLDVISTTLVRGKTQQLVATVPSTVENQSLVWSSDNALVASVDSTGLVTARAVGYATIKVSTSDNRYYATCYVSVVEGTSVTGVSVESDACCAVGKTVQLTATITPSNAVNTAVTWATSDSSVATVSDTGLVTGVSSGNAVISVTTQDGYFTALCTLTVDNFPFAKTVMQYADSTGYTQSMSVSGFVAMSTDAKKLVCYGSGNYLFTSTDGGSNWTQRTVAGSRSWSGGAISDSGMTIVAYVRGSYIFRSMDGGASWSVCTAAGLKNWAAIRISSDGTTILAAASGGYIVKSSDSGATWTTCTGAGSKDWSSLSMSATGSTILASDSSSLPVLSTDGGASWSVLTTIPGGTNITTAVVSGDGSRLFCGNSNYSGYWYRSDDMGQGWAQIVSTSTTAGVISVSSSGAVVTRYDSQSSAVRLSTDYGTTWTDYTRYGLNDNQLLVSADGLTIKLFTWNTLYTFVRN